MEIASRRAVWGLTASLTALPLLAACGAHGGASRQTPASSTSTMTTATAATPTTPIAAPPSTQTPRTKKWIDLEVGDCLADPPPNDPSVVTVTIVDCTTAHQAEVYLRAPVGVNAAIAAVANRECDAGFSQYTGQSIDAGPFAVMYLIDSNQDRTSADPEPSTVICLLHAANGQLLTASAHR